MGEIVKYPSEAMTTEGRTKNAKQDEAARREKVCTCIIPPCSRHISDIVSARNKTGQSFRISKRKSLVIRDIRNKNALETRPAQGKEKRGGDAAGVVGYLAAGFEFTDTSEHARCKFCFVYGNDDDDDNEDEDDKRRRTCTVRAENVTLARKRIRPRMPLASRHTPGIHGIVNP